jgi:hypothetical protein
MMRECLSGHVCSAGKESHTACTAGGVRAVHWLMFRFESPSLSSRLRLPTLSAVPQLMPLLLMRLFAASEYMARSVIFWQ